MGKTRWKAPSGMPTNQRKAVLDGRQCGAKKKSGKGFCKQRPVPGQAGLTPHRCKHHGGNSVGGPIGNQHNFRHGIYTFDVLPEEEEIVEEIKMGK